MAGSGRRVAARGGRGAVVVVDDRAGRDGAGRGDELVGAAGQIGHLDRLPILDRLRRESGRVELNCSSAGQAVSLQGEVEHLHTDVTRRRAHRGAVARRGDHASTAGHSRTAGVRGQLDLHQHEEQLVAVPGRARHRHAVDLPQGGVGTVAGDAHGHPGLGDQSSILDDDRSFLRRRGLGPAARRGEREECDETQNLGNHSHTDGLLLSPDTRRRSILRSWELEDFLYLQTKQGCLPSRFLPKQVIKERYPEEAVNSFE